MKPIRLILGLLACASSLLAQTDHTFKWDFNKALTVGPVVEVPEAGNGPTITFRDGATLTSDADEKGRQVLVLGGAQTDWGRTRHNVEPLEALTLKVRFKPDNVGAPLQTIVTASGCYELRYNLGRERLEFIVNLPDKKYLMIFTEAKSGIWNQAVATYKDGRLTLSVGLSRAENTLPEGIRPAPVSTTVRIGLVGDRPFSGSISEVAITAL